MLELNNLYNIDCMEGMKQFPDKYFELAIVDPPYFTGPEKRKYYGCEINKLNIKRKDYPVTSTWKIPTQEYFDELIRVSKHQIIWGCNYYPIVYNTTGRIIWDKVNDSSSFSDAEIATCSKIDSVRIFRYMWNGMLQGKSASEGYLMQGNKSLNEKRIHPTQKPVVLYKWILKKFANAGDKVLDTHGGSCSLAIACMEMDFEFIAFETDKTHFNNATERIETFKSQLKLF
jgi:site-specific DNA-methyltransferase (adenine-specific)